MAGGLQALLGLDQEGNGGGRPRAASVGNLVVREGRAEDSGLAAGSCDVVLVRLVLLHNGGHD